MPIFMFRAKMGQEKSLANLLELKAKKEDSGIYSAIISELYRGYCFIEGKDQLTIEQAVEDIKILNKRAVKNKPVSIDELDGMLQPAPSVEGLEEGDLVEIVDGPFKGLKANLTRIEPNDEEVTAELLDSTMALPVKIHADYVKKIRNADEK